MREMLTEKTVIAKQLVAEEAYWLGKLSGVEDHTHIPYELTDTAVSGERKQANIIIPTEIFDKVNAICGGVEERIHVLLVSVLFALLYKCTGRRDLIIGSPMHHMGKLENGWLNAVLPLRESVDGELSFKQLLSKVKVTAHEAFQHQNYPTDVLWDKLNLDQSGEGFPLSDCMFMLENISPAGWEDQIACGTLFAFRYSSTDLQGRLEYDSSLYTEAVATRIAGYYVHMLRAVVAQSDEQLRSIRLITEEELHKLLYEHNATSLDLPINKTVVDLIDKQAELYPEQIAIVYQDESVTYSELMARVKQTSFILRNHGVGPNCIVGLMHSRSINLVVGMLAILKAGGAYLPIDPNFPEDRIAHMITDSQTKWVVTERDLVARLEGYALHVIEVIEGTADPGFMAEAVATPIHGDHLAYLMYTSGSTGKPKGVMVTHGNVLNFVTGMDAVIRPSMNEAFLALTTVSFDISVLELLWTLSKGIQVVLKPEDHVMNHSYDAFLRVGQMDEVSFSLLFFSNYGAEDEREKYRLFLETTQFADQNGFEAVWVPERHFHEFGGLFPNPSVLSAAVAVKTNKLRIRSGSVVAPLHHPARVAEEWAVVDNLSGGRVELAFASGWHSDDFVFYPERYDNRVDEMFGQVDVIQKLWRGEEHQFLNGSGKPVSIKTYPRPLQAELPMWITSAGSRDTFIRAGRIGANILTHLLGQEVEDLEENIKVYRTTLEEYGYDSSKSKVAIMLHTFIGDDEHAVKAKIKSPFCEYIRSSIGLMKNLAQSLDIPDVESWLGSKVRTDELVELAFEKYWSRAALFGTPETCSSLVSKLSRMGVNEIACLVDFGLSEADIREGLEHLNQVKGKFDGTIEARQSERQLRPVTQMQCTPSRLKIMLQDKESHKFLRSLKTILIGGEKLDERLIRELREVTDARILNMYGPTETTVWSSAYEIQADQQVSIGRPIANTQIYVLDDDLSPLPFNTVGEICIAGLGVTDGYWNNSALTAERFIPNPFSKIESDRIYRTGDLGIMHRDGSMEVVGRKDNQLKIRGYRIEPGEIETVLHRHPHLEEAVVAGREGSEGNMTLAAYVVASGEVTNAELIRHLRQELPLYMIPSEFFILDRLPLTPNGKVDRKKLSKMARAYTGDASLPSGALENRLHGIWKELLEREDFGVNSNFFELGGHSLSAMMMAFRIHRGFHVQIPLREIFDRQTISGIADYIRTAEQETYTPIPRVKERTYYPTTASQRRLYILSEIQGDSISYNMPMIYRLEGPLDTEKLCNCLGSIVERHEILRTRFQLVDGEPVQRMVELMTLDIPCETCEEHELESKLKEFVRPFRLKEDLLIRSKLLRVDKETHYLLLDMHHIISDGPWTTGIMIRELTALYNGDELEPRPLQYKDYAIWHHELLRSDIMKHQEQYWLSVFNGELPLLNLPTDYPRPPIQRYEGKRFVHKINKKLTSELERLAGKHSTTLFSLLLAVYYTLLSKYTSQEDIVIGTPTAGRNHMDLEDMMGLFINTLAIRSYPSGQKTFRSFLVEVAERVLTAFEHQDYPFEDLVTKLNVQRDLSRNPLFDTLFVLQNTKHEVNEMAGLKFEAFAYMPDISKFDLTLQAEEMEGEIILHFEYSSALFAERTIERMSEHFVQIAMQVANDPEVPISSIDIMTEKERLQITQHFNDTRREYDREATVHALFENQAERYPDRMAVRCGTDCITYRDLNEKSSRLGGYMRAKGIGKGNFVGIMLERSADLLVAILATLKAGAAYVPLDPTYPSERLNYMLEDSNSRLLLTQEDLAGRVRFEGEMIILGRDAGMVPVENDLSAPRTASEGSDLMYVIYTSGSTGNPKGVMIEHRNVVNFIVGITDTIPFVPDSSVLSLTTLSFDIFVLETLLPLTMGMQVVLASDQQSKDPDSLAKLLDEVPIDTIQLTPSRLQYFLGSVKVSSHLKTVKNILIGGEMLPHSLLHRLRETTQARIYNMYGPTETTVWSLLDRLDTSSEITIGKPIANTRVYVVDTECRLLGIGIPGELCIAGDGVSRGYWNNAELTRTKFIRSPFADNELLYRTGDSVKWLPDGRLQFLGRLDSQVKIRGYRIEVGEIESILNQFEDVREAVVVPCQSNAGLQYLAAYYTANQSIDTAHIRRHAANKLPDYMIPAVFVELDTLPHTPNGKIDRKALQAKQPQLEQEKQSVAPATEVEKALIEIWNALVGIGSIGLHDSFLESGGNSLILVLLAEQIEQLYPGVITVADLFGFPTIGQLAGQIESTLKANSVSGKEVHGVKLPELYFLAEAGTVRQEIMQFVLTADETSAITRISNRYGVQHFDVIAAIYAYLLADVINQDEVSINIQTGASVNSFVVQLLDAEHFSDVIASAAKGLLHSEKVADPPIVKPDGYAYFVLVQHATRAVPGRYDIAFRAWLAGGVIHVSCENMTSRVSMQAVNRLFQAFRQLLSNIEEMIKS
ncbi:non-ribosomal peptide synthetase [Paenibacillus amylolyticus]|nr:non-ribosomal peptide synthetase [Paenibacillus amylolyticus]